MLSVISFLEGPSIKADVLTMKGNMAIGILIGNQGEYGVSNVAQASLVSDQQA